MVAGNEDAATSLHPSRRPGLVLLAISQPDDQLLRRLHGHEPGVAAGRGPLSGDFRLLLSRYPRPAASTTSRVLRSERGCKTKTWASAKPCNGVSKSRAYGAGRLSVRREAGEHLFHRLPAADLKSSAETTAAAADQLQIGNLEVVSRQKHFEVMHLKGPSH